ncbi:GDP-mannose-dependent alpha-(1-6)-phosphatidylinositol dimannoside mannosyltransferase [Prochlorococcus marinus str. MIT 1342]|uniref:glycosyltransferase family 4 protein n=1 Tax=Prochlorococcus TaxID=1218 RepID=UPI0007BC4871|nr:glycosyltransferase [Prochlorococcus marinus]KZR84351.1 GDP-mannose-dependent alpha-(1-6)-phosphatidylinositol dimannoside mannosyltransferase [Prochlorococcus marinus str. MIT 1342]
MSLCRRHPQMRTEADAPFVQFLREWPPGFGGVERVAHGISAELLAPVVSLRRSAAVNRDPLPVEYSRKCLPSLAFGRVYVPFPSWQLCRLMWRRQSLLAHLPCPTVLLLAMLARLLHPQRRITIYWHAFLRPRSGLVGRLELLYLYLALQSLRSSRVITTSPVLNKALIARGVAAERIKVLPCALPALVEEQLLLLRRERRAQLLSGTIIFIGRLESYKRVDWLLESFAFTESAQRLLVLGDGPDRSRLEDFAALHRRSNQQVLFQGRVSERRKLQLLAKADVMVLPSDRCNEAFGIVQLEAMASGIPSLAYDLPESGMHWVSALPELPWSGSPVDLSGVLQKVLANPGLHARLCQQAINRYDHEFAHAVWRQKLLQLDLLSD